MSISFLIVESPFLKSNWECLKTELTPQMINFMSILLKGPKTIKSWSYLSILDVIFHSNDTFCNILFTKNKLDSLFKILKFSSELSTIENLGLFLIAFKSNRCGILFQIENEIQASRMRSSDLDLLLIGIVVLTNRNSAAVSFLRFEFIFFSFAQ